MISSFITPVMAQNNRNYVRKQVQPNFYMPTAARNKMNAPEKLATPQYTIGAEETIKVTRPQKAVVVKTVDKTPKTSAPTPNKHLDYDHGQLSQTPDYQQKYQEYLSDLDKIAATGKSPKNPRLEQDLSRMNSNDRISLDQKFNQSRNPEMQFEKVLNQSLAK